MSRTLNMRAKDFAHRTLFLAEPDPGFPNASMAGAVLATKFCQHEECPDEMPGPNSCRRHSQGMILGLSKAIAEGDVHAELSHRGVLFVRLSPAGVMAPSAWSSTPDWYRSRPELIEWARGSV